MADNTENTAANCDTPEQQGDKINKQYEAGLRKLIALMEGDKNLRKSKLPKSDLSVVIAELLKEKKEKLAIEVKTKVSTLLDEKVAFDKEVKRLEEDFRKNVNAQKKTFTDKMNEVFKLIDGIDDVEKSYYSSLSEFKKAEDSK